MVILEVRLGPHTFVYTVTVFLQVQHIVVVTPMLVRTVCMSVVVIILNVMAHSFQGVQVRGVMVVGLGRMSVMTIPQTVVDIVMQPVWLVVEHQHGCTHGLQRC